MRVLRFNDRDFLNSLEFAVIDELPDGARRAMLPGIVKEYGPNEVIEEPTFTLSREAAQLLLDNLWRAGFRPRENRDRGGVVEAMAAHLADMRRLVFDPKD